APAEDGQFILALAAVYLIITGREGEAVIAASTGQRVITATALDIVIARTSFGVLGSDSNRTGIGRQCGLIGTHIAMNDVDIDVLGYSSGNKISIDPEIKRVLNGYRLECDMAADMRYEYRLSSRVYDNREIAEAVENIVCRKRRHIPNKCKVLERE